jgi:hypothetical protein
MNYLAKKGYDALIKLGWTPPKKELKMPNKKTKELKRSNNFYVILCVCICLFGFVVAIFLTVIEHQNKIDSPIIQNQKKIDFERIEYQSAIYTNLFENQNTIINMHADNMREIIILRAEVNELKDALVNVNELFGMNEVKKKEKIK